MPSLAAPFQPGEVKYRDLGSHIIESGKPQDVRSLDPYIIFGRESPTRNTHPELYTREKYTSIMIEPLHIWGFVCYGGQHYSF